jgi:hypothetical protein
VPRGGKIHLLTIISFFVAVALVATVAAVTRAPSSALAHCDSINGPVVSAAREALEKGDVDLVPPHVQPDAEVELTAALEQTDEVRQVGGAAQDVADRWFFETAVRLHRQDDGAPYTGLNEQTDFGPAVEAAGQVLESGSTDEVSAVLEAVVRDGVAACLAEVQAARETAARDGTVEANRERVELELAFEKYVGDIYQAAQGSAPEGEEHAVATPVDTSTISC